MNGMLIEKHENKFEGEGLTMNIRVVDKNGD